MATEKDDDAQRTTRVFLCRYYWDDTWWSLDLHAYDRDDAEARARALGRLKVDGELIATVPSGRPAVGWLVHSYCWARNALRRGRATYGGD